MTVFEKIVYALQYRAACPRSYGIWHIFFLLLVIAASILLVRRFRDTSDETLRKLLFVFWVIMVALEAYKQLVYSMDVSDGVASWHYQWYAFPFQFCSTPMYALPFIIWLKDGRVRDAVIAFMATFSLFAGVAVMIYPGDVFITMVGINIQTMYHHGTQVVLGVFLAAYCRRRLDKRFYLGSLTVFSCFAALAMILNVGVHALLVANGSDATFNMFFISPYHPCTLPVLSAIYPKVPYPVFLLIYLVGFAAVSAIMMGIEKGIVALTARVGRAHKPVTA